MYWLFLLMSLGAMAVALRTTSMALMAVSLLAALALLIAWIMGWCAARAGSSDNNMFDGRGGAAVDQVNGYTGPGWQIRINAAGHWVVQNASGDVDELIDIEKVVINGTTYLLVDQQADGDLHAGVHQELEHGERGKRGGPDVEPVGCGQPGDGERRTVEHREHVDEQADDPDRPRLARAALDALGSVTRGHG